MKVNMHVRYMYVFKAKERVSVRFALLRVTQTLYLPRLQNLESSEQANGNTNSQRNRMSLLATNTAPSIEEYTPLSEHQQQTPGSFWGGKLVLHLRSTGADLKVSNEDLLSQPALAGLRPSSSNGSESEEILGGIDVWVLSRCDHMQLTPRVRPTANINGSHLTLWSTSTQKGVEIQYQSITVHAQEGDAVFLGLNLSDNNTADEDLEFIQLRIIPASIEPAEHSEQSDAPQQPNGNHATPSPSQALFKAISDCQELNPDPPEDDSERFDETAPDATGWITSENMQDFMDENGELRIPEGATVYGNEDGSADVDGLGEGAGRTRTAAELDAEDGAEDATKWQRTD